MKTCNAITTTFLQVKAPKEPKAAKEKKPSAPSAYIIFCKEERNGIVATNPEASFGEIGKLLGEKWKSLSDTEKAVG